MDPLTILIQLLPALLGLLGQFLAAFLTNWTAAQAESGLDANIFAVVLGFTRSAEANAELKTGDDKWQWVFDRTMEYLSAEGKTIGKSLLNTAIELAVQKLKIQAAG